MSVPNVERAMELGDKFNAAAGGHNIAEVFLAALAILTIAADDMGFTLQDVIAAVRDNWGKRSGAIH